MRDLSIAEAEALHGGRLDRRCRYATPEDGVPCNLTGSLVYGIARWSEACSGCYEGYYTDHGRGHGCSECGYTGRSRREHWVPIPPADADEAAQAQAKGE
jgi:hypothetical protein